MSGIVLLRRTKQLPPQVTESEGNSTVVSCLLALWPMNAAHLLSSKILSIGSHPLIRYIEVKRKKTN